MSSGYRLVNLNLIKCRHILFKKTFQNDEYKHIYRAFKGAMQVRGP